MPQTVNTTRPNAKNEIGRMFRLNSLHDVKYAAANKNRRQKNKEDDLAVEMNRRNARQ